MLSYSATLPEIITSSTLQVESGTTLKDAITLMNQSSQHSCEYPGACGVESPGTEYVASDRTGYVLVMAGNKLKGILTERDVVRLTAQGTVLGDVTVDQCMTQPVITLNVSDYRDVFTVLSLLRMYQIRHLPISNEVGDLVGIVTPESLRKMFLPNALMKMRSIREIMNHDVFSCDASMSITEVALIMSQHRVSCLLVRDDNRPDNDPVGIITERDILQYQVLEIDIGKVIARDVMSAPLFTLKESANLWEAHCEMKEHGIRRLAVVNDQGQFTGLVTQSSIFQAFDPVTMARSVESLQDRVGELEQEKMTLLQQRNLELEKQVLERTRELQQQADFDRLISRIAQEIRSSLHLKEILNKSVTLIREQLNVDRVLIYEFSAHDGGFVLAESTKDGRPSLLGKQVTDPCFSKDWEEAYRLGRTRAVSDIYDAGLSPCHLDLLKSLDIRSQVVVPIVKDERLWGLMTASQSDQPRNWTITERDLLVNLATHVAIAIQQSMLYEQSQADLLDRQKAEAKVLRLNAELEQRVDDRTSQLNQINQELVQEIEERQKAETQLQSAQLYLEARVEERTNELQQINSRLTAEIRMREETELALIQKQNFLSAVLGVADAFVLVFTVDGRIIQANLAWNRVMGTPEKLTFPTAGRYFVNQETAQLFNDALVETHQSHQSQHLETEILTQAGDRRNIAWSQTLLEDGGQSEDFVIAIGVDITDRKEAEEALRRSEEKYSSLFQFCSDCIIVHDFNGRIVEFNRKACEIFGYSSEELKEVSILELHCNQTAEKLQAGMTKIHDEAFQHFEAEFKTKGDETFVAEVSSSVFELSGQKFIQAIIRDVTQRKLTEEALVRLNEELETKFERRTIQLIQTNRQLHEEINERRQFEDKIKASLKEKEMLLKEIHHRVKNNLFVASSLLELQSDHIEDPEVVRFLEDSQNRIYSMALVHEQLYRSTDIERINFGDYLESLIENLSSTYDFGDREIDFELDSDDVFLNIETANPCGLIVNELISNSIKHAFSKGGEGKVRIKLKNVDDSKIRLSVYDNGVGFPAHIDFRDTESLGLQLICSLTEQIEGDITLESDQGTTFNIEFSELQYRQRV